MGLASDLKYRLGIPFRKISDLFGEFFNLPFCAGGILRAAVQIARRGPGVYDFIRLRLSLSPFVHADETSWYLDGSAWLHAFTSGGVCRRPQPFASSGAGRAGRIVSGNRGL